MENILNLLDSTFNSIKSILKKFLNLQNSIKFHSLGAASTILAAWLKDATILDITVSKILIVVATILFAIGVTTYTLPAFKKTWESNLGKTAIIIVNLFVLILSRVIAQNTVGSVIGLPPSDFEITVSLFTLIFYIPAWSLVFSAISGAGSIIFYLAILKSSISKKASPGDAILMIFNAFGCLAIATYASNIFQISVNSDKELDQAIKWTALISDYHNAGIYPGFNPTDRIRLHENGIISIATIKDNKVKITASKFND